MVVLCIVFCYFANGKCASACANEAVALVVQNTGSFTVTTPTMMAYNVLVSVEVTNEDKTKFVEVV